MKSTRIGTPGASKENSLSETVLSRRALLKAGLVTTAAGLIVPGTAISANGTWYTNGSGSAPQAAMGPAIPKWPQPNEVRQIWLQRKSTGESVIARYYDGQNLIRDEYVKCCEMLRDVQAGSVVHMDLELLDLVFAMQKWLVEWGIDRPFLIHSGYRSPRTNANTEGAAKNSMHVQGRALDFTIAGIPSDYMGRLASIVGIGGVGFYIGKGITHIDTGRVRVWQHGVR